MQIRRVRAFRAIVEAGGLTKAAELLHMTPGALSKSLRQLEQDLGSRLFDRDGRGLRLTESGRRFYHVSATLIDAEQHVLKAMDASEGLGHPTLRLATYEVFSTYCLGALLEEAFGGQPCQVLELHGGDLERAVADHEADLGITYVPAPAPGLTFRSVSTIEFGIYARAGCFDTTPFETLPFAIPMTRINPAISDILGIDCWPYQRIPRQVMYRLTSLESALELARRGLCAVYIPSFLAGYHNHRFRPQDQLQRQPEPPNLGTVTRPVYLVHRDQDRGNDMIDKAAQALATVIHAGQEMARLAA